AAGLRALPGEAVAGSDGGIDLAASAAAVPARFRFIAAGPRFDMGSVDVKALLREQLLLVHEAGDGRVIAATGIQLAGALDEL
ncbi:hypothetical protein ABTK32_19415, partial [Acinetobacter baumannii]